MFVVRCWWCNAVLLIDGCGSLSVSKLWERYFEEGSEIVILRDVDCLPGRTSHSQRRRNDKDRKAEQPPHVCVIVMVAINLCCFCLFALFLPDSWWIETVINANYLIESIYDRGFSDYLLRTYWDVSLLRWQVEPLQQGIIVGRSGVYDIEHARLGWVS